MLRFVLSLALAVCVGTVAYAKDGCNKAAPKKTVEEQFKALDTNSDNKLSLEEFLAPLSKITDATKAEKAKAQMTKGFKKADKDNDGFLSLDEFKALKEAKPHGKKPAK